MHLPHILQYTTLEQKCAHFCSNVVYCGIWDRCTVGFVWLVLFNANLSFSNWWNLDPQVWSANLLFQANEFWESSVSRGNEISFTSKMSLTSNLLLIFSIMHSVVLLKPIQFSLKSSQETQHTGFMLAKICNRTFWPHVSKAYKIHINIYRNCPEVWKCSGLSEF